MLDLFNRDLEEGKVYCLKQDIWRQMRTAYISYYLVLSAQLTIHNSKYPCKPLLRFEERSVSVARRSSLSALLKNEPKTRLVARTKAVPPLVAVFVHERDGFSERFCARVQICSIRHVDVHKPAIIYLSSLFRRAIYQIQQIERLQRVRALLDLTINVGRRILRHLNSRELLRRAKVSISSNSLIIALIRPCPFSGTLPHAFKKRFQERG